MSRIPRSANTSASPSLAQQTPTAPLAICISARSGLLWVFAWGRRRWPRSEEHTSELQSLAYLVCRLLLEKKKKKSIPFLPPIPSSIHHISSHTPPPTYTTPIPYTDTRSNSLLLTTHPPCSLPSLSNPSYL